MAEHEWKGRKVAINVVCFDVDETLILWSRPGEPDVHMTCPYSGVIESGHANKEIIERIKKHKELNHYVIVWSGGGGLWAASAVEALGIEEYVDKVMDKPLQYYDDLKAEDFMGTRSFPGHKNARQDILEDWDDR